MAKKTTEKPLTWKPGWNGHPYKGDDWIVANTMIPSRPLTKEEMAKQKKGIVAFAKKTGQKVTVTKDGKGGFKVTVGGK